MILSAGTDLITLSDDLLWIDELWDGISQAVEETVDGGIVIEEFQNDAGRRVSLRAPQPDMGLLTRADLLRLYAWSQVPGKEMTLTLADGTVIPLYFARPAVVGEPVLGFSRRQDGEYWRGELNFILRS